MACYLFGNKPLIEPIIVRLPGHLCISQPQWVDRQARFLTIDTWTIQMTSVQTSNQLWTFLPWLSPCCVKCVGLFGWHQSIHFDRWVMAEWLTYWTQLWVVNTCLWDSGVPSLQLVCDSWSNSLMIGIYPLANAGRHVLYVSSIQDKIYTPVLAVSSPAYQWWTFVPCSAHWCVQHVVSFSLCQSMLIYGSWLSG